MCVLDVGVISKLLDRNFTFVEELKIRDLCNMTGMSAADVAVALMKLGYVTTTKPKDSMEVPQVCIEVNQNIILYGRESS